MAMKLTGWIASIALFIFLLGILALVCFYFPTFVGQLRTERINDYTNSNLRDQYDYYQMKKHPKSRAPKINISEYLLTKKPQKLNVNVTAIKTVSFSRSDYEDNDTLKLHPLSSYTTSSSVAGAQLDNIRLPLLMIMFTSPNYEITTFHDISAKGWVPRQATIINPESVT